MAEEGELRAMLAHAEAAADADEAGLDDVQQMPVEAAALLYVASQPLTQTVCASAAARSDVAEAGTAGADAAEGEAGAEAH